MRKVCQRTVLAWVLVVVVVAGQAQSGLAAGQARAPLAEDVFTNVQVLRGIPVNDFMGTMGIFSAALGMSCEDCHQAGDRTWAAYAADNPRKQVARSMVVMMAAINKTHFRGRQAVTCFSCHRGTDRPKVTPDVTKLYDAPPPEDPRDIVEQARTSPPPEAVLDKYLEAVGGARAAALTSLAATGTVVGYGPDSEPRPIDIAARAPAQRTAIVRSASGNSTTTFDGRVGWMAAPFRPVPVLQVAGADLDGMRLDAALMFPAGIKEVLRNWRVGLPVAIGGREVQTVQGDGAGGLVATLYFDAETALLRRQVRLVDTPVGRIPTVVDYEDYREVSGVRLPFSWTVTWLDGRDRVELRDIAVNVAIDAARFNRPAQ
jgi:hypothetical protein